MVNNQSGVVSPTYFDTGFDGVFATVLRRVYLWMMLGLILTAGAAAMASTSPLVQSAIANPWILIGLVVVELVLVIVLSAAINKLSPMAAQLLFLVYAAINGLTLSVIFMIYTTGSVVFAFVATSAMFGIMSIIGYTTKIDLSKFGSFFLMGLIGLVIGSVINLFLRNTIFDWIITIVGILFFLGLVIYDTQWIKRRTADAIARGDEQLQARVGILGALKLYLDFINIFLYMLRIFGRRK